MTEHYLLPSGFTLAIHILGSDGKELPPVQPGYMRIVVGNGWAVDEQTFKWKSQGTQGIYNEILKAYE